MLEPLEECDLESEPESREISESRCAKEDEFSVYSIKESYLLIQSQFNHLIRDLDLSKTKAGM